MIPERNRLTCQPAAEIGAEMDAIWRETVEPRTGLASCEDLRAALAGIGGGKVIIARGFGTLFFASAVAALLAAGLLIGYLRRANRQPAVTMVPASVVPDEATL